MLAGRGLASSACVVALFSIAAGCSAVKPKQSGDTLYALAVEAQRIGDPVDALQRFEEAASAGSARAQVVVALHQATRELPSDVGEALLADSVADNPWFETALTALERDALNGNSDALMLAGLMRFAGRGTAPDPTRGREMLASAGKQGNGEANFWLAAIAEDERDFARAKYHLEQAINGGYERAYVKLAMLYINDHVEDGNYARGMAILRLAQERGIPSAGTMFVTLLDRNEQAAAEGSSTARTRLRDMRNTGLREPSLVSSQ